MSTGPMLLAVPALLALPDPALLAALGAAAAMVVARPPRVRGVEGRLAARPVRPPAARLVTTAPVTLAVLAVVIGWVVLRQLPGAPPSGGGAPLQLVRSLAAAASGTGLPGVAPAAAVAAVVVTRGRRRAHRAAGVGRRRRSVAEGVLVLAAELRAGTPALLALEAAAQSAPELLPASRVGALGGSVPQALAFAAREPGAAGLGFVSAAWAVSAEMGAGLADTMDSLVDILRAEELAREQTVAALAAPRATARLLCVLPLAGFGLGGVLGAHPWRTLTHTSWGPLLAVAAAVIAGAGLEWVERLAATAEDPGRALRDPR